MGARAFKVVRLDGHEDLRVFLYVLTRVAKVVVRVSSVYLCDTGDHYCVFDPEGRVYVSVRKDSDPDEVALALAPEHRETLLDLPPLECGRVRMEYRELCERTREYLARVKATLSLVE